MKDKTKFMKVLDILIPAVCGVAIIGASIYIYSVKTQYAEAEDQYKELNQIAGITSYPIEEVTDIEEDEADEFFDTNPETSSSKLISSNVDKRILNAYEETFINMNIDFKALEEINSDVVGWLYIPALELSYPVVQGTDNDYYLHHLYDGTANSTGSIILDSDCRKDMTNYNTFIYGHHMKNKSMFGSLNNFMKDTTLIDNNPYVYYYTKDHAFKYRIYSTYVTTTDSFVYLMSENREQLLEYIEKTEALNQYKREDGRKTYPNSINKIITLSTCNGAGTNRRTIVQAYLNDDYLIEE